MKLELKHIFILVILIIVLYFLYSPSDSLEPLNQPPLQTSIKKSPKPKTQKISKPLPEVEYKPRNTPVSKSAPNKNLKTINKKKYKPRPLPTGHVRFQIKDKSWAVTQGDIILGKLVTKGSHNYYEPKAPRLWPSNKIPVAIDKTLTHPGRVKEALKYFSDNTDVQFINYEKGDVNYIYFTKSDEICGSFLGMHEGPQPIRLHDKCSVQNIIHELMHALGFVHEHSRPERDQYIKVHWGNIDEKHWIQFEILPSDLVHKYTGSVFDFSYNSIMIYTSKAFALDTTKDSLSSLSSSQIQRPDYGLSDIDKERIYYLYGN